MSYPLIDTFPYKTIYQQYSLQKAINEGIKEATPEQVQNGKEELFIDFRKSAEGELITKVRDLTKSSKLIGLQVKPSDKEHPNILRIFIDTISRNNFHRKYKETSKFLVKYHYQKSEKLRVYEFFKMHAIQGWTFPNLFASSYGHTFDGWKAYNLKRIQSYARSAGYITGMTSDCCVIAETESKGKNFD